jgi:prephenate dehydrogenase
MTDYDKQAERFWRALGCKTHFLTPEKHDEWVARTSHLPHVLAFALFQGESMKKLGRFGIEAVNPSIRDLARLSKSDPKLWADILISNKAEILRSLAEHERAVKYLQKALRKSNVGGIESFINKANSASHKLAPKIS